MRSIGQLSDARLARQFGDFLVVRGIPNEVERESDVLWSIWIRDEDQIAAAQTWLAQFSADPNAQEFRDAATEAARVRQAEEQSLEEYRKRIRTRKSLFPKFGGYGMGFLTYALIALSMVVAVYSRLGSDQDVLRRLFITDPATMTAARSLVEVHAGEFWRLLTPIFIHFGLIHLIFNLMWLFQLGCMIEGRQSTLRLALLVVVVGLISNLAQFYVTGRPTFGGMSGVVYGLAGYVWIRGKLDRSSGLYLDPQSMTILMVWMVICFTNIIPVANTAHVVGLVVGVSLGWITAQFSVKKQD